jgi:hypothetical protein
MALIKIENKWSLIEGVPEKAVKGSNDLGGQ